MYRAIYFYARKYDCLQSPKKTPYPASVENQCIENLLYVYFVQKFCDSFSMIIPKDILSHLLEKI